MGDKDLKPGDKVDVFVSYPDKFGNVEVSQVELPHFAAKPVSEYKIGEQVEGKVVVNTGDEYDEWRCRGAKIGQRRRDQPEGSDPRARARAVASQSDERARAG